MYGVGWGIPYRVRSRMPFFPMSYPCQSTEYTLHLTRVISYEGPSAGETDESLVQSTEPSTEYSLYRGLCTCAVLTPCACLTTASQHRAIISNEGDPMHGDYAVSSKKKRKILKEN